MANINYIERLHDTNDNQVLINFVNERVDMYGYPCILRKFNEIDSALDDLYQDMPSYYELDRDNLLFKNIHTHIEIDYQRFNQTLQSYGMTTDEGTSLEATMKLEDHPVEDDVIQILYPYDNKYYSFKLGSTDIHRGICYRVLLIPYYQDVKPEKVLDINEPKRAGKVKQIEINNLQDDEVIKI